MAETDTIINQLLTLDNDYQPSMDKTCDNNSDLEENIKICRLLSMHIKNFYSKIDISMKMFKNENWNIQKVLINNEHVLFYTHKYMIDDDKERFYKIFYKYVDMINSIFSTDSVINQYLNKWTDMRTCKWRPINGSFVKKVINSEKYNIISPEYIANFINDTCSKDIDSATVKKITFYHLDEIIKNYCIQLDIFSNTVQQIVESYVCYYPSEDCEIKIYVKVFVNTIITAILDFAEKLIELNIYAIRPIMNDVVDEYVVFDMICNNDALCEKRRKNIII